MISPTDPDYLDTKLVKQEIKQLTPIYQELADWILQRFDVEVLNIYYDKINTDKSRPRLSIIFEYGQDAEKLKDQIGNFDSKKQDLIADQFRKIVKNKSIKSPNLFERFFIKSNSDQFDTDRLLVVFTDFEPVARIEANRKIPQVEIDRLKQEWALKHVWEIYREFSMTTFFFYMESQMEEYQKDGTTEKMKQQYYMLLKQYDEFDYIKPYTDFLVFDSKENFDRSFRSSWFYYSRR